MRWQWSFGCGGSLAEFNTVIFSSTGANVNPGIVPIVNAQTRQISELNPLKACIGDTNNNKRCDAGETNCRTCADVPVGTPCDGGDFREVCCAQVERCVGTPTQLTITFNFRSIPLFDVSGKPLPRQKSPVIIRGYTAVFNYSLGCPPLLFTSDAETVYYVVPAPSYAASTAQVSIKYSTQPFATSVGISNVCMTTTNISFRPPSGFSGVCNVKAVYNWIVMEQYSGKVKTVSVPVSFQIVPVSDDSTCVP